MRTPAMNVKQTAITKHIIRQKCLYMNEKTFISDVYLLLCSKWYFFLLLPINWISFKKGTIYLLLVCISQSLHLQARLCCLHISFVVLSVL